MLKIGDILFDKVILGLRQIGTFVLEINESKLALIQELNSCLLFLREILSGFVQNLLFEREHVRQKVTASFSFMFQPLSFEFASLLLHSFVMLFDLLLDFVFNFERLAL